MKTELNSLRDSSVARKNKTNALGKTTVRDYGGGP